MNRTKTMLRQVVSLLLSFLMSASLVVPAFAETVDAIYKEGDHVYVDIAFDYINVNGSEGYVGAFDYCVYFDDDCLSLSSSSKKISGMLTLDTSTPGAAAVSAVCDEAPESRVVYTYDFIVTENTNNIGVFGECTSLTALSLDESERQLLVDPDLGLTDYYSKHEVRVNDNKEKVYHEGDVVSVGIAVGGIKYEGAAAKLATINYELSYDTKVLEFTSDEKHDNGGSIKAVEKNPGLVRIGALSEDGFEQDYSADTTVLYTRSMVVTKDTDNLGIRGMCISLSGINYNDVPFSLIDGNNLNDTYTKLIITVDCPHSDIDTDFETDTAVDTQNDSDTATEVELTTDSSANISTDKPASSDKDTSTDKPVTSDKDTSTDKPASSDKDTYINRQDEARDIG